MTLDKGVVDDLESRLVAVVDNKPRIVAPIDAAFILTSPEGNSQEILRPLLGEYYIGWPEVDLNASNWDLFHVIEGVAESSYARTD